MSLGKNRTHAKTPSAVMQFDGYNRCAFKQMLRLYKSLIRRRSWHANALVLATNNMTWVFIFELPQNGDQGSRFQPAWKGVVVEGTGQGRDAPMRN